MSLLCEYIRQRSPLLVLALISFCLFIAGLNKLQIDWPLFLGGWITIILFMLLIRLWDDMADIPIDQITHPNRLLVVERDNLKQFQLSSLLIVLLICLLQWVKPALLLASLATLSFFLVFFLLKSRLPIVISVIILNFSLFFPPLYAAYLMAEEITLGCIMIGVFVWFGGIAHDFSHSVMNTENVDLEKLNPINKLDQELMAWASMLAYLLATAVGVYVYTLDYVDLSFLAVLAVATLAVLYYLRRLLLDINQANAKPFYFLGFVYFLTPILVNFFAQFI